MKQIVDKLNKIAKKIDESVEIPQTDLIIDSLDAITKAYGGTPNDSNLIVDKLEDIYNNISPAVSGNIEITENGENINVAPYATATVNVAGGGGDTTELLLMDIEKSTNVGIIEFSWLSAETPYFVNIVFDGVLYEKVPLTNNQYGDNSFPHTWETYPFSISTQPQGGIVVENNGTHTIQIYQPIYSLTVNTDNEIVATDLAYHILTHINRNAVMHLLAAIVSLETIEGELPAVTNLVNCEWDSEEGNLTITGDNASCTVSVVQ